MQLRAVAINLFIYNFIQSPPPHNCPREKSFIFKFLRQGFLNCVRVHGGGGGGGFNQMCVRFSLTLKYAQGPIMQKIFCWKREEGGA